MIFSIYNHLFVSKDNRYLLYNAQTNALIELDISAYNILKRIKEHGLSYDQLPTELVTQLMNASVFINDQSAFLRERKLSYYINNYNSDSLGLAIAPTTFCNFSCPYCYEENRVANFMSEKTERNVINFIKGFQNTKFLNITWYGGEPLCGFRTIKNILNELSNEESIKLRYHSIITNGYLLDEEKSLFFAKYPLHDIQITIDGTRETHNKRRVLTSGDGTFDAIIKNIDTFIKINPNTNLSIRVNIDNSNHKEFIEIYRELKCMWPNNLIYIYPAFVKDYTENCSQQCNIMDQNERVQFYIKLYEEYDLAIDFYPHLRTSGCGANNVKYYVVGPEGELYKCWNDIGVKEKVIGYVDNNNIVNRDVLNKYLVGPTMFDDEKCQQCQIFPICDGGCYWLRLKNEFENKQFDLCSNRKNNVERFIALHCDKLSKK